MTSLENFKNVIADMLKDFSNTFPEYAFMWSKWMGDVITDEEVDSLYKYCCNIYPEFFFDILYNNEDIFDIHYEKSTCFLPCVEFKSLYNCAGISETTKKTIWNYLQLILMIIVQSIQSKENFGDITQQLFSGVNEEDLYSKIKETIENLSSFFDNIPSEDETKSEGGNAERGNQEGGNTERKSAVDEGEGEKEGENEGDGEEGDDFSSFFSKKKMPDIKEIYQHLSTLFNGKIGGLAKELAEEISQDMNDMFGSMDEKGEPIKNSKDIIQQLLKNPEKMTNIIKNINDKLQSKIKSGELSQEELVKEASDILGKMKDMGDMKEFKQMFKSFSKMSGMGGGAAKNMKFDFNALDNMTKKSSLREKMKKKLLNRQLVAAANTATTPPPPPTETKLQEKPNIVSTENPHHFKFVVEGEENVEKTPVSSSARKNKKKKKPTKKVSETTDQTTEQSTL